LSVQLVEVFDHPNNQEANDYGQHHRLDNFRSPRRSDR